MKRLAALCLLALTACQPKDPEGTLVLKTPSEYSNGPALMLDNNSRGQTVPFRLKTGNYKFFITQPESDIDDDLMYECQGKINLLPYGKMEGRVLLERGRVPSGEFHRVNALPGGLYVIDIEASETYCVPDVLILES